MYKHANIGLRLNSPIKTAITTKPALAATRRDHLKYKGLLKNSIILLKLQDYCLKINVITIVSPVLLSELLQGSSRLLKLAESNTSIVTFYGTFISNVPYCHNLFFKWRTTQPQFLETSVIFLFVQSKFLISRDAVKLFSFKKVKLELRFLNTGNEIHGLGVSSLKHDPKYV